MMQRYGRRPDQLDTPEQSAANLASSGLIEVHIIVSREREPDQRRLLALSAPPTQKLDAAVPRLLTATRYTPQQIRTWQGSPALKPLAEVATRTEETLTHAPPLDEPPPPPDDKPPPPPDMAEFPKLPPMVPWVLLSKDAIATPEPKGPSWWKLPSSEPMLCLVYLCIGKNGRVTNLMDLWGKCPASVWPEIYSVVLRWRFKPQEREICTEFWSWSRLDSAGLR